MTSIRRPVKGGLAVLAGAVLMAGCAALQPAPDAPQALEETPAPAPLLPVASPPVRPPDARWLDGLTPAEVQQRLGDADFVRMEPGAHLMQYRGAACSLDVVFRPVDAARSAFRVDYLAARRPTGAILPVDRCLEELVAPARWPAAP